MFLNRSRKKMRRSCQTACAKQSYGILSLTVLIQQITEKFFLFFLLLLLSLNCFKPLLFRPFSLRKSLLGGLYRVTFTDISAILRILILVNSAYLRLKRLNKIQPGPLVQTITPFIQKNNSPVEKTLRCDIYIIRS